MSTVPANPKLRLEWWEAHITQIAANAVAVGTTTTATSDLSTKITTARAKYLAKLEAEAASKVATSEWRSSLQTMGIAGAAVIDQIRAKAKLVGGVSIYELAGIPAPATPSPVGPPGEPTELKVGLTQTGALDLSWKCANPPGAHGVTYNVFRRTGDVGDFTYIGGTGVREFTDESAPGGAPLLTYKIQAVRSTSVGPWATFNVFLGVNPVGGSPTIQSVVNTTPKVAA